MHTLQDHGEKRKRSRAVGCTLHVPCLQPLPPAHTKFPAAMWWRNCIRKTTRSCCQYCVHERRAARSSPDGPLKRGERAWRAGGAMDYIHPAHTQALTLLPSNG
jgi:hypothetical protein